MYINAEFDTRICVAILSQLGYFSSLIKAFFGQKIQQFLLLPETKQEEKSRQLLVFDSFQHQGQRMHASRWGRSYIDFMEIGFLE